MTELLEFAFQKGGIAGVVAVLAVAALIRVYREKEAKEGENREHVKARHADDQRHHREFAEAQVAWKDEVIKIKDACEASLLAVNREYRLTTEKLVREQVTQQEANVALLRDLARSKTLESKVIKDVPRRLEELEGKVKELES